MRTPASIANHPIHPMLVAVPIGLWLFSFACDLLSVFGASGEWPSVARYTMAGGVVGALLAAVPGFIDLLSLEGRRKRVALLHMGMNLTIVLIYVVNLWLRIGLADQGAGQIPYWLSAAAISFLAISGWLGGKLVYELGVAVDPRAGESP